MKQPTMKCVHCKQPIKIEGRYVAMKVFYGVATIDCDKCGEFGGVIHRISTISRSEEHR